MSEDVTLKVFDVQDYSVHDGPGIRITVFTQGCPLRCKWCHSIESQSTRTRVLWLNAKCIGCLKCQEVCPTGARGVILPTNPGDKPIITCDWDKCDDCGKCTDVCIPKALYWSGAPRKVEDIVKRLEREKPYFIKSGGGVTASGGECLLQPEGVAYLLKRSHEIGINTCVDTCGYIPWENIEMVLPHTDLFLYDLKHMDSEKHKEGTGVPNELILENCRKIAEAGGKMQIRIPLIPGYNDGQNIIDTCEFLKTIREGVFEVQVLPYHNYGDAKYARLSMDAPDYGFRAPTQEESEWAMNVFVEAGFKAMIH